MRRKTAKSFKMPHTYVIIFGMVLLTALLANIVPAGEFTRVLDEASGKMVVVADSFHYLPKTGCSLFEIFTSIKLGFSDGSQIIFFIVFAYAFVYMLLKNGTFDAVVGAVLRKIGTRVHLLIPICMIAFGVLGSTIGLFEETYGLLPIFISIAIALGFDAIVGGSIVYIAVAVGFAAATINPFTIGIAQEVSQVPLFSGLGYRVLCFFVFMGISILYVWRYAEKVRKHPETSILAGEQLNFREVGTKEELMKVGELCLKHDILIVSDEIHFDLILPGHEHTVFASLSKELSDRMIVCTSVSKTFNLAGMQCSNIVISNPDLRAAYKATMSCYINGHLNIMAYEAATLAYRHCEGWLDELLELLETNRKTAVDFFAEHFPKAIVSPLEGTYLLWVDLRVYFTDQNEQEEFMTKKALLFLDEGYLFGEEGSGFERINLACPTSLLKESLMRLAAAYQNNPAAA